MFSQAVWRILRCQTACENTHFYCIKSTIVTPNTFAFLTAKTLQCGYQTTKPQQLFSKYSFVSFACRTKAANTEIGISKLEVPCLDGYLFS